MSFQHVIQTDKDEIITLQQQNESLQININKYEIELQQKQFPGKGNGPECQRGQELQEHLCSGYGRTGLQLGRKAADADPEWRSDPGTAYSGNGTAGAQEYSRGRPADHQYARQPGLYRCVRPQDFAQPQAGNHSQG